MGVNNTMASRKTFEIFLYKNKLNTNTLIDILPQLSVKTIQSIYNDLNVNQNQVNQNQLYVFSDGGCRSNGKRNPKAGYSIFFTDDQDSQFYDFNATRLVVTDPTNNKAELSGIKAIYKTLYENTSLFQDHEVIICTDSMYSINCIDKWSKSWVKNNWKNAKGEDVKNQEIIKQILEYKKSIDEKAIKTIFRHVFSHTQEPSDKTSLQYKLWYGNNLVDENINKILNLAN